MPSEGLHPRTCVTVLLILPAAFLLAFLAPTFVDADAPSAGQIAARFELSYKSARTLQVNFLERYEENGKVVRAEAGTAYFRRPGRMRWQYESPERNLFLVDGKSAWFYTPSDHTVTRVPAKKSSDWRTPLALLAEDPKLIKICSQISIDNAVAPATSGNIMLFCSVRGAKKGRGAGSPQDTPLEDRAMQLFLEVQPADGLLARVLTQQPGGVGIEFKFANWQFNPPLPEPMFHFEVPPDTAIVNGD